MTTAIVTDMQDRRLGTLDWNQETGEWSFDVGDPEVNKALSRLQFRGSVPMRTGEEVNGAFLSLMVNVGPTDERFLVAVRDYLAIHSPNVFNVAPVAS